MNYNSGVNDGDRWICRSLIRKLYVFIFLSFWVVFSLRIETLAAGDVYAQASALFYGWEITATNDRFEEMIVGGKLDLNGKYYFMTRDGKGNGYWTSVYYSDEPFVIDTSDSSRINICRTPGSSVFECRHSPVDGSFDIIERTVSSSGIDFTFYSYSQSIIQVVSPNFFDSSGGASDSDVLYNSIIPAPQNLTFSYDKTGGIFGIGSATYHKLSWSNKLVDEYSVRVSARGQYTDSSDNGLTKKDFELMVVSDGSDGADVGAPASSGFVQFNLADIMQKLEDSSEFGIDSCRPTQYRVQFYKYVDGVLQVGPVGVVNLSVNMFGVWTGTVSTTEVPIDKDNIGQSGGFMGSDAVDGWTSDGQDYQEYDSTGTQTGTGVVGDPDSYVPSGSSGGGGSGGIFQELIQGLLNIPNVVSQLFSSLKNAMSGIGELPAFFTQVVSWLPSEIVSLISLGIILVIVLRIFGR